MASAANNLRGATWIVGSAVVATIMSSGIHELAGSIHSAQAVFIRGVIGSLLILAFSLPHSDFSIRTKRLKQHIVRGVIGVVAINLGFYSLQILPLATVTALFFTTPLFVTALSVPMLKEKVGIRRIMASIIGFLGAMLVIGYLPEPLSIKWFAPIFASVAFSLTLVTGKQLSSTERPGTIVLYFSTILALGSLPPAIIVWQNPSWTEWGLLTMIAAMSSLRNYMDVRAYALGDAQFVSPFLYTRIIFMVIAGYFLFDEIPQISALIGASIIIMSTLYILHREVKIGRQQS